MPDWPSPHEGTEFIVQARLLRRGPDGFENVFEVSHPFDDVAPTFHIQTTRTPMSRALYIAGMRIAGHFRQASYTHAQSDHSRAPAEPRESQ